MASKQTSERWKAIVSPADPAQTSAFAVKEAEGGIRFYQSYYIFWKSKAGGFFCCVAL
ncbi:hypothetical protein [Provencibacterium massiliense]|uniref:hypothetical protein n=1 Tax=Provencibacterium massiliense TaxID=1841868 RepID=UPI0013562B0F|nr:hypothetical protein [Provencibacterium massiliense]